MQLTNFSSTCPVFIIPRRTILIVKWKSLSHVQLFATLYTIESMEFSRQEYWSGLLFPPPGIFPTVDRTCVSWVACIDKWILYHCTTWEVPTVMAYSFKMFDRVSFSDEHDILYLYSDCSYIFLSSEILHGLCYLEGRGHLISKQFI